MGLECELLMIGLAIQRLIDSFYRFCTIYRAISGDSSKTESVQAERRDEIGGGRYLIFLDKIFKRGLVETALVPF